jgi:hypothetical protein
MTAETSPSEFVRTYVGEHPGVTERFLETLVRTTFDLSREEYRRLLRDLFLAKRLSSVREMRARSESSQPAYASGPGQVSPYNDALSWRTIVQLHGFRFPVSEEGGVR